MKTGDQLVCVIGLNGDAEWESNNTCDEGLVKRLGDFIEENEL